MLADVAWTDWSSVQELRIVRDSGATASVTPERWSDTWRFALGATYAMNDRVTLRAGVALDETPVPDDTRTPRLPDSDRTWVAIGAHWEISPALLMDFGYAHLFSDTVSLDQDTENVAASATERAAVLRRGYRQRATRLSVLKADAYSYGLSGSAEPASTHTP